LPYWSEDKEAGKEQKMITANEAKRITEEVLKEEELRRIAYTQVWMDTWLSEAIGEAAARGLSNLIVTICEDVSLCHLEIALYKNGFSTERVVRSGDKMIRISW
jgi:hypothetical protein